MSAELTLDEIRQLHQRCIELLDDVSPDQGGSQPTGHVADAALVELLAWKVVVPILTAITGGIVTRFTGDALKARRDRRTLKKEAEDFAGKAIAAVSEQHVQECVDRVETVLLPFGIRRVRVERIVRDLVSKPRHDSDQFDGPAR